MGIISRNSASSELESYLSKSGARWNFESGERPAWKRGFSRGRFFEWKIIPMDEDYVLIHVTPGRIIDDAGPMHHLREAIRFACSLDLQNTRYLAQGIDEPDMGVRSFCISFFKTYHWRQLAELFLADLDKNFFHRNG